MTKRPVPIKIDIGDRITLTNGQTGKVVFDVTTTPVIIQLDDGGGLMRVAAIDVASIEKAKEDASA